ncbi:TonB-dependent receptor [Haliscomenobacter sp.]|uniref:TonB-dependent receptor n=1 Tax=Haliscomenobacter sp. TaxID=2717303 RepID=UPI00359394DF
MKSNFLMLALLFLLSSSAWAQVSLRGKITDATGQGLAGANVWLEGLKRGTTSDRFGGFSLPNLSAGTYQLVISYVGYQDLVETVELNSTHELNFVLSEKTYSMDALVVKSTRSDRKTPMTYSNLNAEQIGKNNQGQDVPFILQWTPSAVVTSDAGTGIGYTGIRIRGTDATRINVTINGIPLNDAESQGTFWVNMPDFASSTNDVQIQRGVGTSTNGAAAFGASINLNTAKVYQDAYAELNGTVGSFNTLRSNVQFGTGLLKSGFSVDGRLSKISSDGYIDRARSDLSSYFVSAAWTGKKQLLRLNVFSGHEITYQAWNGVPANLINDRETRTYNSAGTEKPGEPYNNEVDNYRQTHYQLIFNRAIAPAWNLNLALHYTRGLGFYEQYKAGESFADYNIQAPNDSIRTTDLVRQLWLDNDFYGGVYALSYNKGKVDFSIGGGYNIYDGRHYGKLPWLQYSGDYVLGDKFYQSTSLKKDFNVYAKLNYQLARSLYAYADLQVRSINYTLEGNDRQKRDISLEDQLGFFNPKFGFSYLPNSHSTWYTSFAVANREPNRDDYLSALSNFPEPERLYDTELGYKYAGKKGVLELALFHMYYRDQLAVTGQINDVGSPIKINVPKSYRLGLELSGGYQLNPMLRVQGNAAFSRNKIVSFTEYLDDYDADFNWLGQQQFVREQADLALSPNLIAGAELAFSPFQRGSWADKQSLTLSLLTRYVGQQFIDNSGDVSNTLKAYSFSDLRVVYQHKGQFLRQLELSLWVNNLFDAMYSSNAWSYRYIYAGQGAVDQGLYPMAGRNVMIGAKVRF